MNSPQTTNKPTGPVSSMVPKVVRAAQAPLLKVAVVSKSDSAGGGASRVAQDLARLLNTVDGVMAHHWVGYAGREWEAHMRPLFGGKYLGQVHRVCRFLSNRVGLPDFLTPEMFQLWIRKEVDYDIYHFHDISATVSPIGLRWLCRRRPVVWTFHDCSPFTGGCICPLGCTAFHRRCGHCPLLAVWPLSTSVDRTGFMQSYKNRLSRERTFVAVAPCRWMADEATRSEGSLIRPMIIPSSVDTSVFRPLGKAAVRDHLGIPSGTFAVMVSAMDLSVERKGARFAIAALKSFNRPIQIILVGRCNRHTLSQFAGLDVHPTGLVTEPRFMALCYAAADVFLFPSVAENLPLAILEAMASGTPPIAFRTGGIPEMVDHHVNGWLAEPADVAGLVEGLQYSFDNRDVVRKWAEEGRARTEKLYSRKVFLEAHLALYKRILDCWEPGHRIHDLVAE